MMPYICNRYAEIVISSASKVKRQTSCQWLEAAYNMHCTTNMSGQGCVSYDVVVNDYMSRLRDANTVTDVLRSYEGDVRIDGKSIRRAVTYGDRGVLMTSNVKANYGIIRVMQSSSFRMSSTHTLARCQ
jgi:hypothetical protein